MYLVFFCHSHSHSHSHNALCNVYPVALDRKRRITLPISLWLWQKIRYNALPYLSSNAISKWFGSVGCLGITYFQLTLSEPAGFFGPVIAGGRAKFFEFWIRTKKWLQTDSTNSIFFHWTGQWKYVFFEKKKFFCPIHVVTFTLISILGTVYI